MFALTVTTDGRGECLRQTIASLRESLLPWPAVRCLVDDSGDLDYAALIAVICADFRTHSHVRREGFAASVEDVWRVALRHPQVRYVFHAEDDFVYNEPVDLHTIAALLDANPMLAQIALKRQPVNAEEHAAGGFMQTRPPETWQQADGLVEHALNFTTNPSLIPRHAIEAVLKAPGAKTEPQITDILLSRGYTFGYLGEITDPPRVHHIGEQRMAGWLQ